MKIHFKNGRPEQWDMLPYRRFDRAAESDGLDIVPRKRKKHTRKNPPEMVKSLVVDYNRSP